MKSRAIFCNQSFISLYHSDFTSFHSTTYDLSNLPFLCNLILLCPHFPGICFKCNGQSLSSFPCIHSQHHGILLNYIQAGPNHSSSSVHLSLNFTPAFLLLKVAGEKMHNDTDFSDFKFKTMSLMKVHHAAAIPSHFPSAFTLHLPENYFKPSLSSNLQH